MSKITIETDVFNAIFLARGLETFVELSGGSTQEWSNISEETAKVLEEMFEDSVSDGDDSSDNALANFKALHDSLITVVNNAVNAEGGE